MMGKDPDRATLLPCDRELEGLCKEDGGDTSLS